MKILGIAGTKEAGKSSLAKYLLGYKMFQLGLTEEFQVNDNAELMVTFEFRDRDTNQLTRELGVLDIEGNSVNLQAYLDRYVYPHIKIYNFADPLKEILFRFFNCSYESLYRDKNLETPIKLSAINKLIPKSVKRVTNLENINCTGRESLQYIAEILRTIDDDCFIRDTVNKISSENTEFAIIADVRTLAEVQMIKASGGKIIYLKKFTHKDSKKIENELKEINEEVFDIVVDNTDYTPNQTHVAILNEVKKWGWI